MKSVKNIVLDALKLYREEVLSEEFTLEDDRHALSLQGAKDMLDAIYPVNKGVYYTIASNDTPGARLGGSWTSIGYITTSSSTRIYVWKRTG